MPETLVERLDFTVPSPQADSMDKLIRVDPIESAGSLLLIDPTHPSQPWASGVPSGEESPVTNLLAETAEGVVGQPVAPLLRKPASFTGFAGLLERSSKGGLHGIVPQAGTAVKQSGPIIDFGRPLMKYLLDHSKMDAQNHHFYVSMWIRPTRLPRDGYTMSTVLAINGNAQQTNSFLFHAALTANNGAVSKRPNAAGATGALGLISQTEPVVVGAPYFFAAGMDRWSTQGQPAEGPAVQPGDGVLPNVTGNAAGAALGWAPQTPAKGIGATGTISTATVIDPTGSSVSTDDREHKAASHIFYRTYLEDLTVSGRTFAEVAAIDQALYTKEVLTAGGRYHGDTFTDPSTLP